MKRTIFVAALLIAIAATSTAAIFYSSVMFKGCPIMMFQAVSDGSTCQSRSCDLVGTEEDSNGNTTGCTYSCGDWTYCLIT